MRSYTNDKWTQNAIKKISGRLGDEKRDDLRLYVPISDFSLGAREFDTECLTYDEDYELGFTFHNEETGEDLYDFDDVKERIKTLGEDIDEIDKKIADLANEDPSDKATAKEKALEAEKAKIESYKEAWETVLDEPERDEIYSTTVWRPRDESIDQDLAHECGLGVVIFKGDKSYIGFTGGGMNLSPQLLAYTLLAFGVVHPEWLDFVTVGDRAMYAKQVLPAAIWERMMDRLGIAKPMTRLLKQALKDQNALNRRQQVAFNKRQKELAREEKLHPKAVEPAVDEYVVPTAAAGEPAAEASTGSGESVQPGDTGAEPAAPSEDLPVGESGVSDGPSGVEPAGDSAAGQADGDPHNVGPADARDPAGDEQQDGPVGSAVHEE